MEVSSQNFVNREDELKLVREAVAILQDKQQLLRTPIVEFSGVGGIGKSTLLERMEAICGERGIFCVKKDALQITAEDFTDLEMRMQREPVTMMIDALEAAKPEQMQIIETRLGELVDTGRSFVVLASRSKKTFEGMRSIARRLTLRPLEPLNNEGIQQYFEKRALSESEQEIIQKWARGYPLAMEVMATLLLKGQLDPTNEDDQKQLLAIVIDEVIVQTVLAAVLVKQENLRLQMLLSLFSMPRQFNLILMQDLIEEFEPEYKLKSSLAYITLPKTINEFTSVLYWNMERAGYCIDAPVRNLLLVQKQIEHPQQYVEIHKFLAQKNERFMKDLRDAGSAEQVRYLREFFYHLALYAEEVEVRKHLEQYIGKLMELHLTDRQDLQQPFESFTRFYEEFQLDTELKEALGQRNTRAVLKAIDTNFLSIYRNLPEKDHLDWIKTFFTLIAEKRGNDNFAFIFEDGIRLFSRQVSRTYAIEVFNELVAGSELKALLGEDFSKVQASLDAELLSDGVLDRADEG
jgi:hypothetical protein